MELGARFERLEREVRFWRRFSILLAIGGALAFLVAAGPKRSRVVTAERFELVGADGKKAGDWWVAEDGPALRMDGAGGSGVRLGADNGRQQQSFVRMWGPKNSSLIILESYAESAQVKLLNPGGGGHYLALVQDAGACADGCHAILPGGEVAERRAEPVYEPVDLVRG
jgi:hypothetical protein